MKTTDIDLPETPAEAETLVGITTHDLLCKIAGEAALNGEAGNSDTIRMARCLRYLMLQIKIVTNGARKDGAHDVEEYLIGVRASARKILHNANVLAPAGEKTPIQKPTL